MRLKTKRNMCELAHMVERSEPCDEQAYWIVMYASLLAMCELAHMVQPCDEQAYR